MKLPSRLFQYYGNKGPRGGAVGWGAVSLEFFIDIILGSTHPLTEMSTRNISRGVKAAGS
jgi:hypothetical protein